MVNQILDLPESLPDPLLDHLKATDIAIIVGNRNTLLESTNSQAVIPKLLVTPWLQQPLGQQHWKGRDCNQSCGSDRRTVRELACLMHASFAVSRDYLVMLVVLCVPSQPR